MNEIKQPIRLQRKRSKGFKLPPNTVCVNRGTRFGNPFRVEYMHSGWWGVKTSIDGYVDILVNNCRPAYETKELAVLDAVKCHKIVIESSMLIRNDIVISLQGYNLACFCPLDSPCHADILLKIANE